MIQAATIVTGVFQERGEQKEVCLPLLKNSQIFIWSALISALLLSACRGTGPTYSSLWAYVVSNASVDENSTCPGNLRLEVRSDEVVLHNSIDVPDGENNTENKRIPESIVFGSPITIEAWCLDESEIELGYLRFESPLLGGEKASNIILGDKLFPGSPDACLSATEARGVELCLRSRLFDGE